MSQVVEITENWSANVSDLISTGQRSFIFMENGEYPGSTAVPVTCPVIGDSFGSSTDDIAIDDVPWDTMYCRKIRTELIKNTFNNKLITCWYTNEPWDIDGALGTAADPEDLPRESAVGGENQAIGESTGWKWQSDDVPIKQPMYKRIGVTNFSLVRIIAAPEATQASALAKITNYVSDVLLVTAGMINDDVFLGFESERVLFEGASLTVVMDHMSCPAYQVKLNFAARTVTGKAEPGLDGWNYVLRVKGTNPGTWAKPQNAITGDYLYRSTDFTPLFE